MNIKTNYGIVYDSEKQIIAIKTPENNVYPSDDTEIFECETESELNSFIEDNGLIEKKVNDGFTE